MTRFYIYGTGGLSKEIFNASLDNSNYDCIGFITDLDSIKEDYWLNDMPLLHFKDIPQESNIAICIGDPDIRKSIYNQIVDKFPSVKFPNIYFGNIFSSFGGFGNIFCHNSIVNGANFGNFNIFNMAVTIGHDCKIGDFCSFAPGVHINGNNKIGSCVYFGTNSSTKEKINIGNNVFISGGSFIHKDIQDDIKYINGKLIKE